MSQLIGNHKEGLVFVVSAPAGTGKTTLVQKLVSEFSTIVSSISWTTRKPREGEQDGVHYHFVTSEAFEQGIEEGEFLEYVRLYGDYYGTSKHWVEERLKKGHHVVLVIDTQGALQLMEKYPAIYIFLLPPSRDELRRRLLERRSETDEVIEKRLAWADKELPASKLYNYRIVNDDLETAYQVLRSIVIAEEHKK